MSGQYGLTEEDEKIILKILDKMKIDYMDDEVSIHISEFNSWDVEFEPHIEKKVYVQVN